MQSARFYQAHCPHPTVTTETFTRFLSLSAPPSLPQTLPSPSPHSSSQSQDPAAICREEGNEED